MKVYGKYFYGNEVSEHGQKNGYVDYRTLAQAFDAVMSNDIISKTAGVIGEWEPMGAGEEYYEDNDGNRYSYTEAQSRIDELREELEEVDDKNAIEEIESDIESLEDAHYLDVFQWFIVDGNGADILQEAGEIVYYNSVLDMYIWGVTHYGTSWDYVLTNIRCNASDDAEV